MKDREKLRMMALIEYSLCASRYKATMRLVDLADNPRLLAILAR